jgi:hypothetical protein
MEYCREILDANEAKAAIWIKFMIRKRFADVLDD